MASKATSAKPTPGLAASLVTRGGRPEPRRLAANDPNHPGLYADIKAQLCEYAREEMRLSGGTRVHDPREEQNLEPWMLRRRFT